MTKNPDRITFHLWRPYFSRKKLSTELPILLASCATLFVIGSWKYGIFLLVVSMIMLVTFIFPPTYRKIDLTPENFCIKWAKDTIRSYPWARVTAIGTIVDKEYGKRFFLCTASLDRMRRFLQKHLQDFERLSKEQEVSALTDQEKLLLVYMWKKGTIENSNLLFLHYKDKVFKTIEDYCAERHMEIPSYDIRLNTEIPTISHH